MKKRTNQTRRPKLHDEISMDSISNLVRSIAMIEAAITLSLAASTYL